MTDDAKKEIRIINERFYESISVANLSMMEELWAKTDEVKCVHPGWPVIMGWKNVRESWQTIFESGLCFANIEVSNVYIDVNKNSAWLNCVEKISYVVNNRVIITMAQTTNIFEKQEQKWKIVLHHASPMPIPQSEIPTKTTIQ